MSKQLKFHVTNPDGSEPDFAKIRREESWGLWRILETPKLALLGSGNLIAVSRDEYSYHSVSIPPPDRFVVHFEEEK